MHDVELRQRIDRALARIDRDRWLRRGLVIAAVCASTGGLHALEPDAGAGSDAAAIEDAGFDDDEDYAVPLYGVDIGPGCGGLGG